MTLALSYGELHEALAKCHYMAVRKHHPAFVHPGHKSAISGHCGLCAEKLDCVVCGQLAASRKMEPLDRAQLARAYQAVALVLAQTDIPWDLCMSIARDIADVYEAAP